MSNELGRPILVTIFGAISFIIGLLVLIAGILVFMKDSLSPDAIKIIDDFIKTLGIGSTGIGTSYVVLGFLMILVGIGFLRGWSIFWFVGAAVWVIALIINLYALYKSWGGNISGAVVDTIISLILVLYLFSPKVKNHFLS